MADKRELFSMETGKLVFRDGKPLVSIEHPDSYSRDIVPADDPDPASIVEGTIALSDDLIVKQAVTVRGIRTISRREVEDIGPELAIVRAKIDLQNTFDAWLWINAEVYDWRLEPALEHQRDYMTDRLVVQIYARGWLDIDVRLADHQAWLVELP